MQVVQEWVWQGQWDAYSDPAIEAIVTNNFEFYEQYQELFRYKHGKEDEALKNSFFTSIYIPFNESVSDFSVALQVMQLDKRHYYSIRGEYIEDHSKIKEIKKIRGGRITFTRQMMEFLEEQLFDFIRTYEKSMYDVVVQKPSNDNFSRVWYGISRQGFFKELINTSSRHHELIGMLTNPIFKNLQTSIISNIESIPFLNEILQFINNDPELSDKIKQRINYLKQQSK